MTAIGLLCLGAAVGAIIAGPWFFKAGYRNGYYWGSSDVTLLMPEQRHVEFATRKLKEERNGG
jgi:hypothetical protein